jgi:hypothetical protein
MSHPDPLFDHDNSYNEDFDMDNDTNYDDYNDFYDEDNSGEIDWENDYDDSMDGDHDSAMESAGWGLDEDYGFYGDYGEDC